MGKAIGIGETILDILFHDNRLEKAVPGGSVFNSMVSLARCGIPNLFISELGKDRVGRLILDFMVENNLSTENIELFDDGNSPVSLAFLDKQQNAEYQFYRNFPEKRLQITLPEIEEDDIVLLGSYFAVNRIMRKKVGELLQCAVKRGALIYYDINFRKPHAAEKEELMPAFRENFTAASIVRCSREDLETLFPGTSPETVYEEYIAPACSSLVVTGGAEATLVVTATFRKRYPVEIIRPVSTVGAGDNFNAGFVYELFRQKITSSDLQEVDEATWDRLIDTAHHFAKEACLSLDNYIPAEFAEMFKQP